MDEFTPPEREILARHFSTMANVLVKESSNIEVQVSFGITSFPADGQTTMELIALADSRMYQSKLNQHLTGSGDPPATLTAD
jgi:GGDEF domain-containing protein